MDEKSMKFIMKTCFKNGNFSSPIQGQGLLVDDVLQGHVHVLHVAGARPVLRYARLLKRTTSSANNDNNTFWRWVATHRKTNINRD
jgi:hypothetical protein